jgi:hypothetical protein
VPHSAGHFMPWAACAQILSKTMDSTTLTPDKVELSTLAVNATTGLVRALSSSGSSEL